VKWIENVVRRLLYCFFIASLVTKSFQESDNFWGLPSITWIVLVILFVTSWKVEKEFQHLFIKRVVEEGETPIDDFEQKHPYLSNLLWQFIVTFGAIHVFFISLDWMKVFEVNGQRVEIFIFAIVITSIFRLFDKNSYPNSFNIRK